MLCDARANANAIASIADLLLQHLEHGYGRCSKLLSLFAASTLKKHCPNSALLLNLVEHSHTRAGSAFFDGCFGSRSELVDSLCDLLDVLRYVLFSV